MNIAEMLKEFRLLQGDPPKGPVVSSADVCQCDECVFRRYLATNPKWDQAIPDDELVFPPGEVIQPNVHLR